MKKESTLGDPGDEEKQYHRDDHGCHIVLCPVLGEQPDLKDKHKTPKSLLKR